jgi:hypothetical protein
MKKFSFHIMHITCVMLLALHSVGLAQDAAPTVPEAQKLTIREEQHKLDTIEKQQQALQIQYDDVLQKIQQKGKELEAQHGQQAAKLEAAYKAASAGVDDKKWALDRELLIYKAVPPPQKAAAPAASTEQAKK